VRCAGRGTTYAFRDIPRVTSAAPTAITPVDGSRIRIHPKKSRRLSVSTYVKQLEEAKYEIIFGWDPMMNTFFAHVIDMSKDEDDEDRDVLWVGCTPNEILDVEVLVESLKGYWEIDDWQLSELYCEANG
jgi:hypothetical protein